MSQTESRRAANTEAPHISNIKIAPLFAALGGGAAMFFTGLLFQLVFGRFLWPSVNLEYENPLIFHSFKLWHPRMWLVLAMPFIWSAVAVRLQQAFPRFSHMRIMLFMWAIGSLPSALVDHSAFRISLTMLSSWLITSFAKTLIGGTVLDGLRGTLPSNLRQALKTE